MSEENVELARRFYPGTFDLVARLENPELIEFFRPLVHPRFETVGAPIGVSATDETLEQASSKRTVYGVEGFVEGWRGFLSAWDTWVLTATEFTALDSERVLVLLDIRARSKTHSVEIPIGAANILTFRDGLLARLEMFSSRSDALDAAGPSE